MPMPVRHRPEGAFPPPRPAPLSALLAALLLILAAALAPAPPAAADEIEEMTEAALIDHLGLGEARVGYVVFDLETGERLAERDADGLFIPASVIKLPTAIAALDILGPDYRFRTSLHTTGQVNDGVLDGDVILRGGGDPFLFSDHLQLLAQRLSGGGIRSITGDFVYDSTLLTETPQIDPTQPVAVAYNTAVAALSVNFNQVRLRWQGIGAALDGEIVAVTDNLQIPVPAIAVSSAPAGTPAGTPFLRQSNLTPDGWMLSPELPAEGEDWLPVAHPPALAATLFRILAAEEGVVLPDPVRGVVPAGAREVAVHESARLWVILREVLRYSNNMSAELVGQVTSRALTGAALPMTQSAATLQHWFQRRLGDVDWSGARLMNHSGLSSDSRMSPNQMAAILADAHSRNVGGDFPGLLRQLTWADAFNEDAPEGASEIVVRGKTGTMHYGMGLAGLIDTAGGRHLGFVFFVSDIERRNALDRAMNPLTRWPDPDGRRWVDRARVLEQELVRRWATGY
ncbi:MAG: D-alanyl-D-alanine carboxypeptidase/D-alanyl-D-alanine-endopeptidase [Azospirillaceae bacterium]